MIEIKNISKSFGRNEVLKGVDLSLQHGRVYGIAGENGAGKTTLFRCIAGLDTCKGSIDSEYSILKNQLGFLPTNPVFMSRITGWEYLKLFAVARGIKEDNFEERNIFDLPLNDYAEHYSTGMKKKLALYAILLQRNDVFILDEPFNGVDIQSNLIITEIISELKKLKKTILISSHIFSTLRNCCDEIHLLRGGNFIRSAFPQDFHLIEKEMVTEIVGEKVKKLDLK